MTQIIYKCPDCGRFLKAGASCPACKKKGQAQKVDTTIKKGKAKATRSQGARLSRDKWQPRPGVVCATCGDGKKDKTGIVDCDRFKYRIGAEYAKTGAACRT